MLMTLVITRPVDDAQDTATCLAHRGHDYLIEPMMRVMFRKRDTDFIPADCQGLLMTSANGVRAFVRVSDRREMPVYAVGDATARVARRAGFDNVLSANGDVVALARLVCEHVSPHAGMLLHSAATVSAGDLGGALRTAGFTYEKVCLYETQATANFSVAFHAAYAAKKLTGVLLYSPKTAQIFCALVRHAALSVNGMTAYCLSSNVATIAHALPWKGVSVASAPTNEALLATVGMP